MYFFNIPLKKFHALHTHCNCCLQKKKKNENLATEIKTQAQKAAIVDDCLNDLVLINKYMRKETKSKIYKATGHPITTYALETRVETSETRQMLEANEMKLQRKIVGKTKIDRIRSQQIRESCGIRLIKKWVEITGPTCNKNGC